MSWFTRLLSLLWMVSCSCVEAEASSLLLNHDGSVPAHLVPVSNVTIVRLYADKQGETHFREEVVPLFEDNFAPPSDPMQLGPVFAKGQVNATFFVRHPTNWSGANRHCSPQYQLFAPVTGWMVITTSDGSESRRFGPGDFLLLDDVDSLGHTTVVDPKQDTLSLVLALHPDALRSHLDQTHVKATAIANDDAISQEDSDLKKYLKIVENGLPKVPTARIGIVGAGMAGLVAAVELKRAGHTVKVFEQSHRVGGRAQTFRSEKFTEKLHAEAGPMRFPPDQFLTHAYIQKQNLPIQVFVTSNPDGLLYFTNFTDPIPRKYFDSTNKEFFNETMLQELCVMFGVTNASECMMPLLHYKQAVWPIREALNEGTMTWDDFFAKYDRYSTRSFLQEQGWSDAAILMFSIVENQEAWLDNAFQEFFRDFVGRSWDDESEYKYPPGYGAGLPTKHLWELVDGTDSLPSAFYADLGSDILFGAEVVELDRSKSTESTITWRNTVTGGVFVETFDLVIVAIPAPRVRQMKITPALSSAKAEAIRTIGYSAATKVLLQFSERFWEKPFMRGIGLPGGIQGGGSTSTDLPIRSIYYPSHDNTDEQRGVLLAFTWGYDAAYWAGLSEEQRQLLALRDIAEIHGDQVYDYYEVGTSQAWSQSPSALMAYANFLPNQQLKLYPSLVEPEGRLFWAGEHCSFSHMWIQGAIESALRVGLEVQEFLNATAPVRHDSLPPSEVFFPELPEDWLLNKISPEVNQSIYCMAGSMFSVIHLMPNSIASHHQHQQEQFGYVLDGTIEVSAGGTDEPITTYVLGKGKSYHMPPNVFHTVRSITEANVIELFQPRKPICNALGTAQIHFASPTQDKQPNVSIIAMMDVRRNSSELDLPTQSHVTFDAIMNVIYSRAHGPFCYTGTIHFTDFQGANGANKFRHNRGHLNTVSSGCVNSSTVHSFQSNDHQSVLAELGLHSTEGNSTVDYIKLDVTFRMPLVESDTCR